MEDLDFKEELKDIEDAKNSLKNSLIVLVSFLIIGFILHLYATKLQTFFPAYVCYSIASISLLASIFYKFKGLELMNELAHKRLDEMADKIEELRKKDE